MKLELPDCAHGMTNGKLCKCGILADQPSFQGCEAHPRASLAHAILNVLECELELDLENRQRLRLVNLIANTGNEFFRDEDNGAIEK